MSNLGIVTLHADTLDGGFTWSDMYSVLSVDFWETGYGWTIYWSTLCQSTQVRFMEPLLTMASYPQVVSRMRRTSEELDVTSDGILGCET